MKLNDYMLVSDLQLLSEQQYNSLLNYLKFLGIKSVVSYDRIKIMKSELVVLTVYEREADVSLVWTSVKDNDLASKHSYEDIIRMAEMGELMAYENR